MVRELIKPTDNTYILNLPDEMVGKTIEVIAFEIDDDGKEIKGTQTLQAIKDKYGMFPRISHDNFKFDRDEANDWLLK